MELKQLEFFLVVSKELHFTKSAEKLGISQPYLSQQIRLLEHEVGTPLLDRIGKKTALTEAGRIFLVHTMKVFDELEQARRAIDDLKDLHRGKISIGSLLTVVNYLLPPTILAFHNLYPNVEMSVLGLRMGEILHRIMENELDMGIVFLPIKQDEIETIPLYTEELSLAVSANHKLAGKSSVKVDILKTVPSIMLPENYYLRKLINDYCSSHGFLPKTVLEMTTMESIMNMVSHGVGVTVLPKPYLEYLGKEDISIVPIVPAPKREIGIAYRKDKYMNTAIRVFLDHLKSTSSKMGVIES